MGSTHSSAPAVRPPLVAGRHSPPATAEAAGGLAVLLILTAGLLILPVRLEAGVAVFQQGLDGYTGTVDTEIRGGTPDQEFSAETELNPDGSDGGENQSLIRFENLFGNGPGQIPPGKVIQAVTLTLDIPGVGDALNVHRVNKAWAPTVTWTEFDPINLDGVLSGTYTERFEDNAEAVFEPEATIPDSATGQVVIELSPATVQAWADGAPNNGWVLLPTGTDGADITSSEGAAVASRPKLTVTWSEPGEPLILPLRHTPFGFDISIEDGTGAGATQVDSATLKVQLDSADVTTAASVSKTGSVTTVRYRTPARFAPLSQHVANIAFSDNGVPARPQNQDLPFQTVPYALLTAAAAVPEAEIDKTKPGFIWRVHQNDDLASESPLRANSNLRALQQLNGLIVDTNTSQPFDNRADPAFQGVAVAPAAAPNPTWAALSFEIATTINLGQTAGETNGNFGPDEAMPGIASDIEGIAGEILTYLELPEGFVTMGVNSDDGFITTAGNASTRQDALAAVRLGEFDAGRGAADTIFYFVVEQAGFYGLRTIWEEGTGGANIEWFSVKENGTKVLINDTANGGLRAYRAATSTVNPYILSAFPVSIPRMVNQPSSVLSVVLADGTNPVDDDTVTLSLNGNALTSATTRQGRLLTATYRPTDLHIPRTLNNAKVEYKDSTGAFTRSAEWSFRNFKNIVLPPPKIVENFDSTAEGEVPADWTRVNFSDCSGEFCTTPGLDINILESDTYKDWVVVSATTLEALKPGAFNVPPGLFVNGVEVTQLIEGNLIYAESDVRDGDQVQFVTTKAFDLSGFTNQAVLSFNSIYEQNQDSIGAVEYSVDDGTNWLPVVYFLDSQDGGGDIKYNPDGSVDAVATLTGSNPDTASWTENGVQKGDTYGALIAAPITADLGPYIEPRLNDDDFEGKRPEVFLLPDAAGKSRVRLRLAQGGTGSWYFGIDNLGFYDVAVSLPDTGGNAGGDGDARFNTVTVEQGGLRISWTGTGTLQQADSVNGPWTAAPSQTNPQTVPIAGSARFYRLAQ